MARLAQEFSVIALLGASLTGCFARTTGGLAGHAQTDGFRLNKGDRVVFLGDSLTASRGYTDLVELYALLTYPNREISFFNAGRGGDTAQGGLKRLKKDVLARKPTVVTVCFGINDIGWGGAATPENIQAHHDGIRGIIKECQAAGARVVILGPCTTALGDREDNPKDILRVMSEKDRAIAREMGAETIDLYGQMRTLQIKIRDDGRDKQFPTHAGDGIHLADVGNIAFAGILLKGLGAPNLVSAVEIDAKTLKAKNAVRCAVTGVKRDDKGIRFIRKDEGWPFNLSTQMWGCAVYLPTHDTLAKYLLKVTGLEADTRYQIKVNGKAVFTVTGEALEKGFNLVPSLGGIFDPLPSWGAQAAAARDLMKARASFVAARYLAGEIAPEGNEDLSQVQAQADKSVARIEKMLRMLAPTKPLEFSISPVSAENKHGKQ